MISLRPVELNDAAFILDLRLKRGQMLSKTDNDLDKQVEWLQKYLERRALGEEFYFIVQGENGEKYGTARIYDIEEDAFRSGSFIIKEGVDGRIPIASIILSESFGFENLNLSVAKFEVRKENQHYLKIVERMYGKVVNEDDEFVYYIRLKEDYFRLKEKYASLLKNRESSKNFSSSLG